MYHAPAFFAHLLGKCLQRRKLQDKVGLPVWAGTMYLSADHDQRHKRGVDKSSYTQGWAELQGRHIPTDVLKNTHKGSGRGLGSVCGISFCLYSDGTWKSQTVISRNKVLVLLQFRLKYAQPPASLTQNVTCMSGCMARWRLYRLYQTAREKEQKRLHLLKSI